MDVESLINKKKEEIIEEVKQETEGLHESISNTAVDKLEKFAAELKMAIDMHPIGAKDLLEVIEKGGFVYQKVINRGEDRDVCASDFVRGVLCKEIGYSASIKGGTQKVTLIIEPIEE